MEEKTFYEAGEVKVTSARFIVGGETYPIGNISSVKSQFEPAKRGWAIFLIAIGTISLLGAISAPASEAGGSLVMGVLFLGLGLYLYRNAKAQHIVVLNTSGNDVKALKSTDKDTINKVIKALNDSIVHRG